MPKHQQTHQFRIEFYSNVDLRVCANSFAVFAAVKNETCIKFIQSTQLNISFAKSHCRNDFFMPLISTKGIGRSAQIRT